MKHIQVIALLTLILFTFSCNKEGSDEISPIEIGSYRFNFPSDFTLEELQGIDSYVSNIKGSGITLRTDYGWYTSPLRNLSSSEYHILAKHSKDIASSAVLISFLLAISIWMIVLINISSI